MRFVGKWQSLWDFTYSERHFHQISAIGSSPSFSSFPFFLPASFSSSPFPLHSSLHLLPYCLPLLLPFPFLFSLLSILELDPRVTHARPMLYHQAASPASDSLHPLWKHSSNFLPCKEAEPVVSFSFLAVLIHNFDWCCLPPGAHFFLSFHLCWPNFLGQHKSICWNCCVCLVLPLLPKGTSSLLLGFAFLFLVSLDFPLC